MIFHSEQIDLLILTVLPFLLRIKSYNSWSAWIITYTKNTTRRPLHVCLIQAVAFTCGTP